VRAMPDNRDRTTQGRFKKGNKASMSSGLQHGLGLARLPKQCGTLKNHLRRLRATLQDEARRVHGAITTVMYGRILTATLHEQRCRLAQRMIERKLDDLSVEQFATLTNIVGAAAEARDRAIREVMGGNPEAEGLGDRLLSFLAERDTSPHPAASSFAAVPSDGLAEK
jgi:hypothetical protein